MYFFYLIEQHPKFLLHTLQVLYMFLLFPQVSRNWRYELEPDIETITADTLQTVWSELEYRVDIRRITKCAHLEHL